MEENTQNIVENNEQKNQQTTINADAGKEVKNTENFEEKFDEILASRMDGVAKSVLKANGIKEDDEIKSFIDAWKASKEAKAKAQNDEIEAIKRENTELKQAAFKNEFDSKIKGLSTKLGFDEKYIGQITKLADLSDVKNDDGKLNDEKLEKAISKVLEDCEVFKTTKKEETTNNKGFTVIGAGKNEITMQNENLSLAQQMRLHNKK